MELSALHYILRKKNISNDEFEIEIWGNPNRKLDKYTINAKNKRYFHTDEIKQIEVYINRIYDTKIPISYYLFEAKNEKYLCLPDTREIEALIDDLIDDGWGSYKEYIELELKKLYGDIERTLSWLDDNEALEKIEKIRVLINDELI